VTHLILIWLQSVSLQIEYFVISATAQKKVTKTQFLTSVLNATQNALIIAGARLRLTVSYVSRSISTKNTEYAGVKINRIFSTQMKGILILLESSVYNALILLVAVVTL
jgi:hypothetical protein